MMQRLIDAINKHRPKGVREGMLPSVSFRVGPDGPTNIWLRMVDSKGVQLIGEQLETVDEAVKCIEEKCNVYRAEEPKPPADIASAHFAFRE
jgi:hypothetical protein